MTITLDTGHGINWQQWLTLAVAGVVGLVSYLAYRANRQKLRLDLYQHRFELYKRLVEFVRTLPDIHHGTYDDYMQKLMRLGHESRFLFGKDIFDEINALHAYIGLYALANGNIRALDPINLSGCEGFQAELNKVRPKSSIKWKSSGRSSCRSSIFLRSLLMAI